MHPYSIDTNERKTIIFWLSFLSVLLSHYSTSLLSLLNNPLSLYLKSPAPLAIFAILYLLFDKYFWKWKIFKFWIKTPDLNGVWEGEFVSSYSSPDSPKRKTKGKVKMTIEQTWTKIRICSDNGNGFSSSYSQLAGLFVDDRNGIVLKYEYENDSQNFVDTMTRHTGFSMLKYNSTTKTLDGGYYTDRHRRTYGNLNYKKLCKKPDQ